MRKKYKAVSTNQDFDKVGGGLTSSALSVLKNVIKHIPVGTALNRAIDVLPFELHLPGGYRYCGPGTKLKKRLARGDSGINKLDEACKLHDIAYSKYSDSKNRSIADRVLAEKAWQRVKSSDSSIGERAASLAVASAMKAKSVIGGGMKRRNGSRLKSKRRLKNRRKKKGGSKRKKVNNHKKKGRGLYLKPYRNVY